MRHVPCIAYVQGGWKKAAAVDITAAQAARPGRASRAPSKLSKAAAKAAKPPATAQKKMTQNAKATILEEESSDESSESSDDSSDSSSDDNSDEGPTTAAGKVPRKAVAKAPRKAAAKAPKKPSKPPVKARKTVIELQSPMKKAVKAARVTAVVAMKVRRVFATTVGGLGTGYSAKASE